MPKNKNITVSIVQSSEHPVWALLDCQSKDMEQNVPFFIPMQLEELHFRSLLVAQLDQCIVGIASVHNNSMRVENALGVGYISAHKNFRNIGVATALVKALFTHAKLEGKAIANTPYEIEGEIYLKHIMQREYNRFPTVDLIERDFTY